MYSANNQNYTASPASSFHSKPHQNPTTSKPITPKDSKSYYTKIINHEFRNLQLDPELQSKSLFDLIDYCELLYEKSSTAFSAGDQHNGLKNYIKGYLIFNYFINSFIMVHFKGFDSFIESSEQDFIIYLNVFAFYNTDDLIRNSSYSITLDRLRSIVKQYLVDANLLSFNVEELYNWLYEYITYLKDKDKSMMDDSRHEDSSSESETDSLAEYLSKTKIDNNDSNDTNNNGYSISNGTAMTRSPKSYSLNPLLEAAQSQSSDESIPVHGDHILHCSHHSHTSSQNSQSYSGSIGAGLTHNFQNGHAHSNSISSNGGTNGHVPIIADYKHATKSTNNHIEQLNTTRIKGPDSYDFNPKPSQNDDVDSINEFKHRYPSVNLTNSSEALKIKGSQSRSSLTKDILTNNLQHRAHPSGSNESVLSRKPPPPIPTELPPFPPHSSTFPPPSSSPPPIPPPHWAEKDPLQSKANTFAGSPSSPVPYPLDDAALPIERSQAPLGIRRTTMDDYMDDALDRAGDDRIRRRSNSGSPSLGNNTINGSMNPMQNMNQPNLYSRAPQSLPVSKGVAVAQPTNINVHYNNAAVASNGSHQFNSTPYMNNNHNSFHANHVPQFVHGQAVPPGNFPGYYQQGQPPLSGPVPGIPVPLPDPYYSNGYANNGALVNPSFIPQHVKTQQNQVKSQKLHYMQEYAVCGLRNFGSSCYINSTIQLMFGVHMFKVLFGNSDYQKYIKDAKYLAVLKSSKVNSHHKHSILLSEAISGLLRTFTQHGSVSIAPTKFIRVTSLLKPDLNIPYEQQDAQEFLLFILERLHDELSDKRVHESSLELEDYIQKWNININVKDKNEYLKWYQSLLKHEGTSPVNDLFQGHLQNKLACNKCGYESISYSPFTILSLPIPSSRHNNRNVVDLADCLRYYTQDEVLSGENAWNCPKCTKNSDQPASSLLDNHPVFTTKKSGIFKLGRRSKSPNAQPKSKNPSVNSLSISTKSLNFIKLPQILFIHLSRFSMYNLTDKLDTTIQYPLELKFNNENHEIVYKLSGLINHYGNLKSGHYTALVNKSTVNQKYKNTLDNLKHPFWCLFDDENVKVNLPHGNVSQPELGSLTSKEVYVLCYERV
ncbi:uncharacterized protein RJT20DRAFT_124615 [Scheffersomyces xylosifermentans]|uniref:uncharacterized protein n=1 Tax=Scheffersomyces xylosifermentans TaxID=1304137 RepID=UPI00315D9D73